MILYGIPTCDTCRKALKALVEAGHPATLHDIRKEPLSAAQIAAFAQVFGDKLLNRASTTWRGLDEAARAQPLEALLAAHPALMKRPLIVAAGGMTLGWDKVTQAAYMGA